MPVWNQLRAAAVTVIGALALLSPPAAAQEPDTAQAGEPRFATEVVVTPERGETPRALVPAASVVMDRAAIDALPVTHPGELTAFLPGFLTARPEFHAGRPIVSARGFFGGGEADYVLLLIDGVPHGDAESGLIDWSAMPLSAVRGVEAARGPGASLYGDSAVGGVVQILTNRLTGGGLGMVSGGSFGTFVGDASYGRRHRSGGFHVSGAARRTAGAFDHSAAHHVLGSFGADGRANRLSWQWTVTGDDRDRDDPGALDRVTLARAPYSSDPLYRFDTVERRSLAGGVTLRYDGSLRPQVRVHATARGDDQVRTILLAPGFGDRQARDLSAVSVGGSVEGEYAIRATRPAVVRFGTDLATEHLDTTYRLVDEAGLPGAQSGAESGRRTRTGVFVSSLVDPFPRVRLSAALRWDGVYDAGFDLSDAAVPADQRAWSPRAGAVVRLSDAGTVSVFAQVSRAFKAPTLDQRFDPRPYPDFQGGALTISNPGLVPQRATNVEVGVTGSGAVRWSALAYRMTVEDEIDFDLRTFSYGNIGRSRHVGAEIEIEGRWQRVRPSASYALSRVVDVEADIQLKNVPRHALRVAMAVELAWGVDAYMRYGRTSGAFLDDDGRFPVDGPSTVDLRVRRPGSRYSLFLDLLNVTGNRYEEYGFTLSDFSGQTVAYAYSGAPRAVRGGFEVTF